MNTTNKIIFTAVWLIITAILLFLASRKKYPVHPVLAFFFKHKNHNQMQIVSSLTLTSLIAQVLALAIVDQNNNNSVIPGTLSNIAVTPADPTQDSATSDAAGNVSVDALVPTGGTTVTATADFASTKLQADGVTPVVGGNFSATLTLVNNVVVKAAMVFTQQ